MLLPAGHISIREAVIRVAETRSPELEIRNYLAQPAPKNPLISPKWERAFYDPYLWPSSQPVSGAEVEPARAGTINDSWAPASAEWTALDGAREELRRVLADGALIGFAEGEAAVSGPIPSHWWRQDRGFDALRTGFLLDDDKRRCTAMLQEKTFRHWLGVPVMKRGRPVQARVEAWMVNYAIEGFAKKGAVKREDALKTCRMDEPLGTGASYKQALAAWNKKVPEHIRGRQGHSKPGG